MSPDSASSTSKPTSSTSSSASKAPLNLGTYGAKPYESDGGFSAQGLFHSMVAGVAVAVVLGVVASIVGQFFYAVLIFPLAIGAAVGGIQMWAIRRTKIRTPIACGVVGLVAGVMAVTTMHYVDFLTFREAMGENAADEAALRQAIAAAEDPQEREFLNQMLAEWEADPVVADAEQVNSFASYLDFSARQGVELTSTRGSSKPTNLGYTGSYIYWGIEALIVALVSAAMAKGRAAEPYCVACDEWKVQRELGSVLAPVKGIALVVESGRLSDMEKVGETGREEAAISVYQCACCQGEGEIVLQVDSVTYNNGNRVKSQKARAVYPREAADDVARFFASRERDEMPLCDDIDPETLRMLKAAAAGQTIVEPATDSRDTSELIAAKR